MIVLSAAVAGLLGGAVSYAEYKIFGWPGTILATLTSIVIGYGAGRFAADA